MTGLYFGVGAVMVACIAFLYATCGFQTAVVAGVMFHLLLTSIKS